MNQNKVDTVYVFGAGASRGVYPIINEFKYAVKYIKRDLQNKLSISDIEKVLDTNLLYLLDQYKTPDNYARFLFLNNQAGTPAYQKIKEFYLRLIYIYQSEVEEIKKFFKKEDEKTKENYISSFNYVRLNPKYCKDSEKDINPYVDFRYISLFNNLLSTGDKDKNLNFLKENVRFMTWNYDRSIDYTLATILDLSKEEVENSGLTTYFNGKVALRKTWLEDIEIKEREDLKIVKSDPQDISFYWDKEFNSVETTINSLEFKNLVYIGYSFPMYNWEIDSSILNRAATLEANVIIQDIKVDDIQQLLESRNVEIGNLFIPKDYTDVFYIPNSLSKISKTISLQKRSKFAVSVPGM